MTRTARDLLLTPDLPPQALHRDGRFTEGPVWFSDLRLLLWSDIPNDRLLRWTPDGQVSTFRSPSRFANGNTRDRQGRLVTCEHGARRVTRTEPDGSITVLADTYQGRPLNSPNDVVVRADGTIWFTDPDYGLRQNLPGTPREQDHDHVFRFDPATGTLTAVVDDVDKPNGLAFAPDHRVLYVGDSAVTDGPGRNSHIRRFRVSDDGRLQGGEVFVTTDGVPDGMRVDRDGNLWASVGRGVEVYDRGGQRVLRIGFPDDVTNLCFGSAGAGDLFVTAGPGIYRVRVAVDGAAWP